MKASVLVTDGEERSALAVVRSLGRAGHRVLVASATGASIAGASRHASREFAVVSALNYPKQFAVDVAAIVAREDLQTLLPMSEQSLNAVFAHRELFERVCIPAAGAEQFRAISNKERVLKLASEMGIRVPAQLRVMSAGDVPSVNSLGVRFPVVVKPVRSVARSGERQMKFGVKHCADATSLHRALAALPEAAFPVLVQERIVGPGIGVFLLLWDGELVASFGHRRLRERPPSGGVSVYRESTRVPPDLLKLSRRLLERFKWRGVAMIEYKVDADTGQPYLMEINGRFWGSLQLAIDAGVDFPALLLARAAGEQVYGPEQYRMGIRSRWEWGDMDHLLAMLLRSDADLSLPPGAPGRLQTLMRVLLPWRPGDRYEVFRFSDPAPFLRESMQYFRRQ